MSITEQQKAHVACVLAQMLLDYKGARAERQAIAKTLSDDDSDFSLLEELELLTTDIRGIGSRFVASQIDNHQDVIGQLERLQVLNVPSVKEFYFDPAMQAERLKLYISLLDYLRLLLIGYLQTEVAPVAVSI